MTFSLLRHASLIAGAALLTACTSTPMNTDDKANTSVPTMPQDTCKRDQIPDAVGMQATADKVEALRVATGANMVRVLQYQQMVTKEYRMGRLNVQLGADGLIAQVYCG